MKNIKLSVNCGNSFDNVAYKAKLLATEKDKVVEFDFNGVKCVVDKTTNTDYLWRDYSNSWTMGWKTIGPNCVAKYDKETQTELKRLTKLKEEKEVREAEISRNKESEEKEIFEGKIKGIEIELKNIEEWNKSREINSDPYGRAVLDYAEGWAKLMQVEMSKGNKLTDIAEKTSYELGFMGITGFMYGCAVGILSVCWIYGEELRKWHNKEYGHEGDGVVNPAILTINN